MLLRLFLPDGEFDSRKLALPERNNKNRGFLHILAAYIETLTMSSVTIYFRAARLLG